MSEIWPLFAALTGALAVTLAATFLLRDDGTPETRAEPPSAAEQLAPAPEFRCGYAAERAGIEDPACDELARPQRPAGVMAVPREEDRSPPLNARTE